MGYHVIDPDDLESAPDRPSDMRSVSEDAGMNEMGLRLYRVQPGEDIPFGLHYHDQQEEAFYVVAGELRVETPDREYRVTEGEFFIAEPKSPHRAYNAPSYDTTTVVVGMGAPQADDAHLVK